MNKTESFLRARLSILSRLDGVLWDKARLAKNSESCKTWSDRHNAVISELVQVDKCLKLIKAGRVKL